MDYPFTLRQDDESKVVLLGGNYSAGWGSSLNELTAIFTSGTIYLYRSSSEEEKVIRFPVSQAEMTALLSAWERIKAEQDLKAFLEERRKAAVIKEAKSLVEALPIEIAEEGSPEQKSWSIKSDQIDYTAFDEDGLLDRVKQAIRDHERWLAEQSVHDEVKAIMKMCPAVTVTQTRQGLWRVTLEGTPCVFVGNANTPEELLRAVQAAKEKYEQYQEKQTIPDLVREIQEACPAVTVTREGNAWLITIKGMCYSNYVNTPQELLECVKQAKEMYERDQEKRG